MVPYYEGIVYISEPYWRLVCAGFYGIFFEFLHEEVRYNGAQGASHGNAFNLFIEFFVLLKVAGGQAMMEKNCNVFWEDVLDIFKCIC